MWWEAANAGCCRVIWFSVNQVTSHDLFFGVEFLSVDLMNQNKIEGSESFHACKSHCRTGGASAMDTKESLLSVSDTQQHDDSYFYRAVLSKTAVGQF